MNINNEIVVDENNEIVVDENNGIKNFKYIASKYKTYLDKINVIATNNNFEKNKNYVSIIDNLKFLQNKSLIETKNDYEEFKRKIIREITEITNTNKMKIINKKGYKISV